MDSSLSSTQILAFGSAVYLFVFIAWCLNRYLNVTRHDVAVNSLSDLEPADHIFLRLPFIWHRPTELTRHALYLGQLPLEDRSHPVRAIADFGVLNSKHPVIRPLEDFLQSVRRPNASPDPSSSDPLLTVPLYKRTYTSKRETNIRLDPQTIVTFARRFAATQRYSSYGFLNNGEMYIDLLKCGPFKRPTSWEVNHFVVCALGVLTGVVLLVTWILLLAKVATLKMILISLLAPALPLILFVSLATRTSSTLNRRLKKLIISIVDYLLEWDATHNGTVAVDDPTVAIDPADLPVLLRSVKEMRSKRSGPERRVRPNEANETAT